VRLPRQIAGLAAAVLAVEALAHHSGALFDDARTLTLVGTVRAFQWSNPHCWIQVLVPGEPSAAEWSVEMGSPSVMFRAGWKPGTLREGQQITVVVHPTRDGSHGGLFVSATDADGRPLGGPNEARR
jgi:hypothetical protein